MISLSAGKQKGQNHDSGRKSAYRTAVFLVALKPNWFASDQMCSNKLKVAIQLRLPFYESTYRSGLLYLSMAAKALKYGNIIKNLINSETYNYPGKRLEWKEIEIF